MHYVGSRILILHSMIRYEYRNHFATQLYMWYEQNIANEAELP